MVSHWVKWKLVKSKNVRGADIELETPTVIDISYGGTLLSHIFAMPRQQPISFEDAIRLVIDKHTEAFDMKRFGDAPGHYGWYSNHFVEWISSLGYHIDLTGDEFESYTLSDKFA